MVIALHSIPSTGERAKDRFCLVTPYFESKRKELSYPEQLGCSPSTVIEWVNNITWSFRPIPGDIDATSQNNVIKEVVEAGLRQPFVTTKGTTCDRVDINKLTARDFFLKYVLPQRPVVLQKVIDLNPLHALELLMKHSKQQVDVKLSPSNDFEGICIVATTCLACIGLTHHTSRPTRYRESLSLGEGRLSAHSRNYKKPAGESGTGGSSRGPHKRTTQAGHGLLCREI
jgi:hypothetical protein